MKKYMMAAVLCGCLLIGSLYPRLLLKHHVMLVDEGGQETCVKGEYAEEIPLKIEFAIFKFFRE